MAVGSRHKTVMDDLSLPGLRQWYIIWPNSVE